MADQFDPLGMLRMINQRGIVADHRPLAHLVQELGIIVGGHALRGVLDFVAIAAAEGALGQALEQLLDVDTFVPDVDGPHRGEARHLLAITAATGDGGQTFLRFLEAIVARGDDEARGQALDVPFPGGRQRFVEVVDVEDQPPLGRGENAEVEQMTIAAGLHAEAGRRRVRQIGGHDGGAAAKKSERRQEHSPVANRHQVRNAVGARFFENLHGVAPVERGLIDAVS